LPVTTAWDLGIDDVTAIVFAQVSGTEVRIIDYLEQSGEGLDYYAKRLQEKRYRYAEHLLPHDADHRELGTGKSRAEVLRPLLRALESYRKDWDEGKKTFAVRPRHDWASHGADAFRYLALGLHPA
jgi:phage terminase large subunit